MKERLVRHFLAGEFRVSTSSVTTCRAYCRLHIMIRLSRPEESRRISFISIEHAPPLPHLAKSYGGYRSGLFQSHCKHEKHRMYVIAQGVKRSNRKRDPSKPSIPQSLSFVRTLLTEIEILHNHNTVTQCGCATAGRSESLTERTRSDATKRACPGCRLEVGR
jgi:hypothetical protein